MKARLMVLALSLVGGMAIATPALPKAVDAPAPQRLGVDSQQALFFFACEFKYKERIGDYGGVGGGGGGSMWITRTGYYPSIIPCSV